MLDTEQSHVETEELRLREFVESDDSEVTSWFADAGELRFFAGRRLRWPLDADQWRGIRLDPNVTGWTAVLGNDPAPIGHIEVIRESRAVVRLACLAIAPPLRARGLGRALVAQAVAKCREAGFLLATLETHPDNSNAIRAYRGLGFVPSAAPTPAGGPALGSGDRVQLELRLDSQLDSRLDSRLDSQPDSQPDSES